jgi:hypothetical protein
LDNCKSCREFLTYTVHHIKRRLCHRSTCGCREAKEDDTRAAKAIRVYEFTEISVLSKKDAPFISRLLENFFIADSWRNLGDGQNVVTGRPEHAHYGEVAALVREKLHRSGFRAGRRSGEQNNFFMRDRLCRVGDRSPDVFASEPRIRIEQIVLGGPFRELPKNKFYFDPSPFDDRLSHHHFRIDLDSICRHKSGQTDDTAGESSQAMRDSDTHSLRPSS